MQIINSWFVCLVEYIRIEVIKIADAFLSKKERSVKKSLVDEIWLSG
jgi:hypothetical protein